jgi:hypothetical protein
LFNNDEHISYLKFAKNDTIRKLKSDVKNETVLDFSILKNADEVLGKNCDVLILKAEANGGTWERRYSYTSDLNIDASSFSNYKYNSTAFIYEKLNALPLRIELIWKDRKITYTATAIKRRKLDDSFFAFAPNALFKNGI